MAGPIPEWLLSLLAAATVSSVMVSVGLGIPAGELRVARREPGRLLRGLLATIVVVPCFALAVTRAFQLPRWEEIGVVLMAISPGAPMALRNALSAGSHQGFAASLQIAVALVSAFSMPISIVALDRLYAGSASIAPWEVAKQVFFAQLVPLGLGIAVRHAAPGRAVSLARATGGAGNLRLVLRAHAAGIEAWGALTNAGPRLAAAVAITTAGALVAGHLLGGPEATMRTAVATTAAMRNAGLALLVVTLNAGPPPIRATVMAYIASSLPVVLAYLAWRRRSGCDRGARILTPRA
jgi:predicted Na+-dependent transporter